MKYRKRPVIIDAEQFDPQETPWPGAVIPWNTGDARPRDMTWGYVATLEGRIHVQAGDWIITGIKGEHYPCKPDVFALTYEKVEEEAAPGRRDGEE